MLREMLGIAEGILQDLHNDHQEVDELFGRISKSDDGSERKALFGEMSSKLLTHAQAEQEVLYTRMAASPRQESRRFALEGASEHRLVEEQVEKIHSIRDPMSDSWVAEVKVLQDLVEHHVKEEESEGFDYAREDFGKAQLEQMGGEFQSRKRALKSAA